MGASANAGGEHYCSGPLIFRWQGNELNSGNGEDFVSHLKSEISFTPGDKFGI